MPSVVLTCLKKEILYEAPRPGVRVTKQLMPHLTTQQNNKVTKRQRILLLKIGHILCYYVTQIIC